MKGNYLSVLKNAKSGSITYYTGDNIDDVSNLQNCTLICNKGFQPKLKDVELIHVENPQLEFYKLSREFKKECSYTIASSIKFSDVEIHNGVIIYENTKIGEGTIIESNSSIGSRGMMWVWDGNEKVYLEQLGGVEIGRNCIIGSNCCIVRGSANENTIIGDNTCISPGSMIGHGCEIGSYNHLANGVLFGGSCSTSSYNFFGSGAILNPGVKILSEDVIIGAGALVTKDINEPGVYAGCPAKFIKPVSGKLSGMPKWRNGV